MSKSKYRLEGDKLIEDYTTETNTSAEEKKTEVDTQVDALIQKAVTETEAQKRQATHDYNEIVDTAAIQREIDRKQVAETMANMGLTNAGLNATQQTAIQLSAGNKMAAANRQRQAAVDALTKSLQDYKFEAESARTQQKQAIDDKAAQSIAEYSATVNKNVADAEAAEAKARAAAQEAAAKSNDNILKTLYNNGDISGQTYSMASTFGWNAAQTMEYENNKKSWGQLRDDNVIDDTAYAYFIKEGYTAADAQEFQQKSNVILEILGTKPQESEGDPVVYYSVGELAVEASTKPNSEAAAKLVKAAKQLTAWAATGTLTAAECDTIARMLGFTDEMLADYSQRKDVVVEVPKKYTYWDKLAGHWKNSFNIADIFD